MTGQDLENMGVNLSLFPAISTAPSDQCISPGLYIPDAFTSFDFQKMRLDISIPQAAMKNDANGYIPPEKWDEGIMRHCLTTASAATRTAAATVPAADTILP